MTPTWVAIFMTSQETRTCQSIDVPTLAVHLVQGTTTSGNVVEHRLLQEAREAEDDMTLDHDTLLKADRHRLHSTIVAEITVVDGPGLPAEETTGIWIGVGKGTMEEDMTAVTTQGTGSGDQFPLDEDQIRIGLRLEMDGIERTTISKDQETYSAVDLKLLVPDCLTRSSRRTFSRWILLGNGM
jgi:hypothetical protein